MDQLDNVITWVKNMWVIAKMFDTPSNQALLEMNIKYLEELKAIKEKEEPAP